MMRGYFVLTAIFFVIFYTFLFASITQATPFDEKCVWGSSRQACDPIPMEDFSPYSYSQISKEKDCSNYCFGTDDPNAYSFTTEPVINMTTVNCGDPIIAEFNKLDEFKDVIAGVIQPTPKVDADVTFETQGFTSLVLEDGDRESAPVWWRMLNELGTIYTNLRSDNMDNFTQMDFGKNVLTRSFAQQINDRLEYCDFLESCAQDNTYDHQDYAKNQSLPGKRCVNMAPYDMYPLDPDKDVLVHESEICPAASSILDPYKDSSTMALTDYFFKCDPENPEPGCNPDYDDHFAKAFMAIEPTYKARELMVVCTDKNYEANNPIWNSFFKNVKNTFDCQEFLIPPGLVAACQGMWRQYSAWTHSAIREETYSRLETPIVELAAEGDYSIVQYERGLLAKIFNIDAVERNLIYARRINAEDPNILVCDGMKEAETYGDRNTDLRQSGGNTIHTDSAVMDPDEGSNDYILTRTFIIAPPGFKQCFNSLAHSLDHSMTKELSTYSYFNENEGVKHHQLDLLHPLSFELDEDFGRQCVPQPTIEPDPTEPEATPVPVGEDCYYTWNLEYDTEREVKTFTSLGGNTPRDLTLNVYKKMFTSSFAPDWAADTQCDWYAWVRSKTQGTPIPDSCEGTLGSGGGPIGPNVCEPGSGIYCSPETLAPYVGNDPTNALVASHVCRRESTGGPLALNNSCLLCDDGKDNDEDGKIDLADDDCDSNYYGKKPVSQRVATADYSVGLFQHNLLPGALGCEGAWAPYPAGLNSREKRIWCRVANQSALDACVDKYQDAEYNIKRMVDRACPDGPPNCSWLRHWYTDMSCNFVIP